jgi:outer membrane protein assembly factor BamB
MKKRSYARRRTIRRKAHARFYVIIGALIIALGAGIFFIVQAVTGQPGTDESPGSSVVLTPRDTVVEQPSETPEENPTPTPVPSLSADLVPHAIEGETDPATFGFETDIMNAGEEVDSYTREQPITFGSGDEYTQLEGVITFRGNNYRNAPSWGTAAITDEKLDAFRTKQTGAIGSWGGLAWTGQPLVVKWPDKTRENMKNLYNQFKDKTGLTEVIICSLDGNIYFEELETGEKTRDPIKLGAPIKGTASLDPRGYPILYVGQGVGPKGGETCNSMYFRAYSLIDGKELYKFGAENRDPFAFRKWQAYDSSALIDAETDTLIEPGENGILYTVKLNTVYDEDAGTVTMDPDELVKYRYTSSRNKNADKGAGGRWGIENSAVAWRNYLIFTDNAGMLQCVDINTMQLVYANDMSDDSDVSMVLEEDPENQTFYLYTGCEYDPLVRPGGGNSGTAYARKLDGLTGKIIWQKKYPVVSTYPDGGILASPVLGKDGTDMAGLIIYNVTQIQKDDSTTSVLMALDKETGYEVWRYDMDAAGWSPSSPVPVYTEDGQSYLVQCDIDGEVALIKVDGQTATEVRKLSLKNEDKEIWNKFEATPVVFGNYIVVGSRSRNLFFIKIS